MVVAHDCQEGGSLLAGPFFAPEKRQPSERIFDDIGVVGEYRPIKSPEQCHETCAGDGMTRRVERSFSAKMNKSGWTNY